MPDNDLLRRFLDAGVAFTQLTQKRAEDIVKEFVKAGELSAEQTQAAVQEMIDRSRQNTERLFELIRSEISNQITALGLVTRTDLDALRRQWFGGGGSAEPATKAASAPVKAATKPAPAFPAPTTKKATASKAAAVKKAAKKAVRTSTASAKKAAKKASPGR